MYTSDPPAGSSVTPERKKPPPAAAFIYGVIAIGSNAHSATASPNGWLARSAGIETFSALNTRWFFIPDAENS